MVAKHLSISRDTLKKWETHFVNHGTIGLFPELPYVDVDSRLEKLTILIKSCRPHENVSLALKLADALEIPGAFLEIIRKGKWEKYGEKYRIAGQDVILAEPGKPFRFIVKQNIETAETRCFGSTHINYCPGKILDFYHIRRPVETGIRDLIANYFLNNTPGTSPEKVETHYYCVMLARLTIDYFLSVLCESTWQSPQEWSCTLTTIRTTIFSNQNCELTVNDSGDLQLTYLDGDHIGIKNNLAKILEKRKEIGFNKVSWWGNRAVEIRIKDQYGFK